jgi:tetratricopeptide (TPR) repeat protein
MVMSERNDALDEASECVASDPERALEICEQYLEASPNDYRALDCRFRAWTKMGEFENALADINRIIELTPTWIDYFWRGMFFHNFGHYRPAVDDLTKSRELDIEGSATVHRACYRASALSRLGRLDEALADCALLPEDHWMPGYNGLPAGNKREFIEEVKRRAALARSAKT